MSNNRSQSVVPQAQVVASNNTENVVVVDEEILKQAVKKANDELRRKRQEQINLDEQELAAIKARYDEDLKALKTQLDKTEATEKLSMDAVHRAAQLIKVNAHKEKLAQIRAEHAQRKLLHENRMQLLKINEENDRASWVSKFGDRAVKLYREREEAKARHEAAKKELKAKLDLEKQKLQDQYKEKEDQFKRECNESNEAHANNLLLGVVFGSIAGFIFDRARI